MLVLVGNSKFKFADISNLFNQFPVSSTYLLLNFSHISTTDMEAGFRETNRLSTPVPNMKKWNWKHVMCPKLRCLG